MSGDLEKLSAKQSRPWCQFKLPAAFIDVGHEFWTDDERTNGVVIRLYEATPQDEMAAANAAGASKTAGGITVSVALAQGMFALGVVGGRPVTGLNREVIWRALSPRGRNAVIANNAKMNRISEEAIQEMEESFQMGV